MGAKEPRKAQSRLTAPWYVHVNLWVFMIGLSVSPLLYLLSRPEGIEAGDWSDTILAIVLIQVALWVAQRRCSSEDLSYWEGLLVAAASTRTRMHPVSLALSMPILFLAVSASFVFVLVDGGSDCRHHAPIRFGRLIIAIYRRRLH